MNLLDVFTPEELARALRDLGWTVTPPAPPQVVAPVEDDQETFGW